MPDVFVKNGPAPALAAEVASLRWLAEAMPDGGARVVQVLAQGDGRLELERIADGPATPGAAENFGRALAATHAAGAPHYGCPPAGFAGPAAIGRAPMDYSSRPAPWGVFYARHRIEPYLPDRLRGDFEGVMRRLEAGDFDVPEPDAVGRAGAARIHGDLWAGNVLWPSGEPTGGVLIDPAAHGGHAETDLAMLALFGAPHLERICAAYAEVSPLADGWRERVGLHQLWPLLVHERLFGGGYGQSAARIARRYA